MNRTELRDSLFPNCPIRSVLSRIGDKWSMLVLFTLERQDHIRFKELQRNVPDISQKMLTATLKTLEADGLLQRLEYSLSDRGRSLLPLIDNLLVWATNNMDDIMAARKSYLLK